VPSSLIFTGLVVLWLLILVPAVARHQQEVARPSTAALAGRVLVRPSQRRRTLEVDVDETDEARVVATRGGRPRVPVARTPDDAYRPDDRDGRGVAVNQEDGYAPEDGHEPEDGYAPEDGHEPEDGGRAWERPPSRYRPGRGGFDPEAAALAARARYAARQRVVLGLLIAAVVTALIAAVAVPGMWWLHGGIDVSLVGYLVYLRRQVRMEEAIRARRAARMAGTRRPPAAEDPELDTWARRGRDAAAPDRRAQAAPVVGGAEDEDEDLDLASGDDAERVPGTGEPLGMLPARPRGAPDAGSGDAEPQAALPRVQPVGPPPLPPGTTLVEVDEDDPEQYELTGPARADHRRAAG
jgi:hypothetical protein